MDNIDEINNLHDYYIKQLQNQDDKMGALYQELDQYKNNWEELKKYISKEWYCFDNESLEFEIAKSILDIMKELEEDK